MIRTLHAHRTHTFTITQAAIDVYLNEYGKHLPDLVKSKSSYKNYREFMLKVLECKRNEENKPFDPETAQQYATELYNAGGGRTIGETVCLLLQNDAM